MVDHGAHEGERVAAARRDDGCLDGLRNEVALGGVSTPSVGTPSEMVVANREVTLPLFSGAPTSINALGLRANERCFGLLAFGAMGVIDQTQGTHQKEKWVHGGYGEFG